jgi:thiol-disulfide isomerase/thioredoxin
MAPPLRLDFSKEIGPIGGAAAIRYNRVIPPLEPTMSADSPTAPNTSTPDTGKRLRNFLIALVAIVLTGLFAFSLKLEGSGTSLAALAKTAVPLEVALANGKPTLMEFYADWCTTCQAMAPEIAALETQYADKVNFVMLNVDNEKWLPEVLSYRVDGIPHFVYLQPGGAPAGQAIGKQPQMIMGENLVALIAGDALPNVQNAGQTTAFSAPAAAKGAADRANQSTNAQSDPRSHGAQVKG